MRRYVPCLGWCGLVVAALVCAAVVAAQEGGFVSLFDGKNLDAWKIPEGDNGHWKIVEGVIDYDGKSEAQGEKSLWTKESFRNFVLKVDWRFTREPVKMQRAVILPSGDQDGNKTEEVLDAGDSGIYLRGTSVAQINIWCWPVGSGEVWGYRTDGNQPAEVRRACTPLVRADNPPGQWNTFEVTMRGDRLTVKLNGKLVIDNAQLPGVPAEGAIALQHHGDPIQFRNIQIKKLPD